MSTVATIASLIWFLSKWKLWFVDICTLSILLTRCLVTFHLFRSTLDGRAANKHVDIKQLQDSVIFVTLPFLLFSSCNWKIDSILTIPILMVSNTMTTMHAYSTEGNNMECYADPDSVGELVSTKWNLFLVLTYYYIYSMRNHQLTDFVQK